MRIGELAKKTGCKEATIRFYEKRGIMPKVARTSGNYRNYGEKDLERLAFIKHCRRHGMTLEEIESLLELSMPGKAGHAEIHKFVKNHIVNIQKKIAELEQLKNSLQLILNDCEGSGEQCNILNKLRNENLCSYCKLNKQNR